MTKEDLLNRIDELTKSATESAENHTKLKMMLENATNYHNTLIGRLEEVRALHKDFYGEPVSSND